VRTYKLTDVHAHAQVMLIVVVQALIGVATGFFLRYLDVVLKAIASALEIAIAAVCSSLIFGTPFNASTFLSALIMTASAILYSSEFKSFGSLGADGVRVFRHIASMRLGMAADVASKERSD
jgi:hypothetical protein